MHWSREDTLRGHVMHTKRQLCGFQLFFERMPIHDTRLSVRRMGLNSYRSKPGAFFTIAQTQTPFSLIGFDQNHEQQNKELKVHGGTLNLKHHDQSPSVQQRFFAHTQALVKAFQETDRRGLTLLTRMATKSSLSTPERLCQIMLPAVSWVHMEKERSSMPILWSIACSLQQSHSTRQSR